MDINEMLKGVKCEKCGKIKRQRTADNDNMDAIIQLSQNNKFIFG